MLERASAQLLEAAERARESARKTREGATHEESRAENDKDTRGLEASYLARGQAMRVEELEEAAARLRFLDSPPGGPAAPIALGSLITVEIDGERRETYLLSPVAGGLRVGSEDAPVTLLSAASPVGRALVGKVEGDVLELRVAKALREYEVLRVR